jgi:hypothetical protein
VTANRRLPKKRQNSDHLRPPSYFVTRSKQGRCGVFCSAVFGKPRAQAIVPASGRWLQVSPKQKVAILKSQTSEVTQAATGGVIVVLQLSTPHALAPSVSSRSVEPVVIVSRARRCRSVGDRSHSDIGWTILEDARQAASPQTAPQPKPQAHPQDIDPLYLFACHMEWERSEEPSAGWELLRAAQSSHSETRSHARALLSSSRHLGGIGLAETPSPGKRQPRPEDQMKAPHGLDIIEDCCECPEYESGRFCAFSQPTPESLSKASHKSVLPAGAILFVEGQTPRGVFIVCSGKVNLSTTSRGGKILILKTAGPRGGARVKRDALRRDL